MADERSFSKVELGTLEHARIKEYADPKGIKISWLITTIVREWLDKRERQATDPHEHGETAATGANLNVGE